MECRDDGWFELQATRQAFHHIDMTTPTMNEPDMKSKSLLSKTLKQFVACTAVVFILTAPLFYLLTKYFYAEDMIDIIEAVKRGQGIPPLDLEQDIMEGMMLQFMLIFIVISLSLFITVRFMTKRLWRPFDDTLMKAERFNLAQNDIPRFVPTDIREFERLNISLAKLMEKDRKTFRIQKEFSENASHELQTPLAVMRGKLDLLMQEDMDKRQMGLVADMYGLTMHMSHLNRNLLLLAKIDNAQYSARKEVDVAATISMSLPMYDVLLHGNSIKMEDRRADMCSVIHANPVLLECLVKNLVVNAIRHSAANEDISIVVADGQLSVSNRSTDDRPLEASTLFRRFRSGDIRKDGNGLGLAIVKAVCDFHGWTVEYKFKGNRHCFVVSFAGSVGS